MPKPPPTFDTLQHVAEIYNNETNWAPTRAVVDGLGINPRTALRWIGRARGAGLITRGRPTGAPVGPFLCDTHGTVVSYQRRGCRCDECRAAHTERAQRARLSRQARNADAPHGTASGYDNWKCRCATCRAANSDARRATCV